jgi:hypothetical protein
VARVRDRLTGAGPAEIAAVVLCCQLVICGVAIVIDPTIEGWCRNDRFGPHTNGLYLAIPAANVLMLTTWGLLLWRRRRRPWTLNDKIETAAVLLLAGAIGLAMSTGNWSKFRRYSISMNDVGAPDASVQ